MEDEDIKIDTSKYFGKTRPIDYVIIVLTLILIGVIAYFGITTTCELDCSMCQHTGQVLKQGGII